jgi:threonine/homoserine/homoserine lactone efflux protein
MTIETLVTFAAVAGIAILSPGPAILLALRNGSTFGMRSVIYSSTGNVCGLFCVSAATMLGLGVLLKSSALLFAAVKTLGALYLFYIGLRQLFACPAAPGSRFDHAMASVPSALRLYREAFLIATTNPKAILFFTALFPQFIDAESPLLPQFLVLTAIFMALSFSSLLSYAFIAGRARTLLVRPLFARWGNRVVGSVFIAFGAALLTLRRPLS